jgi:hypothetical protein
MTGVSYLKKAGQMLKTTISSGNVMFSFFLGGHSRRIIRRFSDRKTNHQRSLLFEAS